MSESILRVQLSQTPAIDGGLSHRRSAAPFAVTPHRQFLALLKSQETGQIISDKRQRREKLARVDYIFAKLYSFSFSFLIIFHEEEGEEYLSTDHFGTNTNKH